MNTKTNKTEIVGEMKPTGVEFWLKPRGEFAYWDTNLNQYKCFL